MKIMLASCETGPDTWRQKAERLRAMHARAREARHTLVEDPAEAEMIIISNLRDEHWYRAIIEHPLRRQFPEKCFGLADTDDLVPILRGLYTAASRTAWNFGRVAGGAYTLLLDAWQNPYLSVPAAEPKDLLASFVGEVNHPVRQALFQAPFHRADVLREAVPREHTIFKEVDEAQKAQRQRHFCTVLARSKFALCPRGRCPSSIRLFEAMQVGVAPVIISDQWLPPGGPAWRSCAVFVPERHLAETERILQEHEADYATLGAHAQAAFQEFFAEEVYFNYVVQALHTLAARQWLPERWGQALAIARLWPRRLKSAWFGSRS